MTDLNIIILAAGNSTRMGRPKQTLPFEGTGLLERTIMAAKEANAEDIIVVTGAHYDLVEQRLNELQVLTVFNPDWSSGMATSISAGLTTLLEKKPLVQFAIFAVCDQPFISAAIFQELVRKHLLSGKGIIAAAYQQSKGTPVLFQRNYFTALLQLQGHEGARKLLSLYAQDVESVVFEKGYIDIDTPEDYNRLAGLAEF
ncbi:nucleotidyltransferase family protein [Segetibacter sp. 3557_3]|uniref:nucleotidyltransferase family protein n=1 Tax=Segetibacter sp. 3557_3 TaxID=2547429 RepID=UPI001058AF5C|nr:nucleotidyltransferase family protein [Segetibacter sp. 3557_3]TDH27041.1 nucleotidyltransferase family protein [Segetibacter sp. 3557_3]